jgi:hypothetical protein
MKAKTSDIIVVEYLKTKIAKPIPYGIEAIQEPNLI